MNNPSRIIATAVAKQTAVMLASAIVLLTVVEAFNGVSMWNQARRG